MLGVFNVKAFYVLVKALSDELSGMQTCLVGRSAKANNVETVCHSSSSFWYITKYSAQVIEISWCIWTSPCFSAIYTKWRLFVTSDLLLWSRYPFQMRSTLKRKNLLLVEQILSF